MPTVRRHGALFAYISLLAFVQLPSLTSAPTPRPELKCYSIFNFGFNPIAPNSSFMTVIAISTSCFFTNKLSWIVAMKRCRSMFINRLQIR